MLLPAEAGNYLSLPFDSPEGHRSLGFAVLSPTYEPEHTGDMNAIIIGAIAGSVLGGLAVVLLVKVLPSRACPNCGAELPKYRKPTSLRQMLWGGWVCRNCMAEINRKGKIIS